MLLTKMVYNEKHETHWGSGALSFSGSSNTSVRFQINFIGDLNFKLIPSDKVQLTIATRIPLLFSWL